MSVPDAVLDLGVVDLAQKLEGGEVTSLALTEGYLDRINKKIDLNAFISIAAERAVADARAADAARAQGRRGPLLGIPYALKDIIDTAGIRTTWGTRAFINRVPSVDADVVTRLSAAGAVLLGKLTLTEMANSFGNNEPSANHNGPVRNPWNPKWWAGGSSGGSASSVAAALCAFALGSETWGSIDTPAAFCGVTGLRPTYDAVSRRGVMTAAYTLDKVGPFVRDARDASIVLDAIAQVPLERRDRALRIAIVESKGPDSSPEFPDSWRRAVEVIRAIGSIEEIKVPFDLARIGAIQTVLFAERDVAFESFIRDGHVHEMYDREPFEVKQRKMAALPFTAADYVKASRMRAIVAREWQERFAKFDVVVGVGWGDPPYSVDERLPDKDYTLSHAAVSTEGNLAGLPGITLPIGFTKERLPISMHAVASPYDDHVLVQFAAAYQQRTDFHKRRP